MAVTFHIPHPHLPRMEDVTRHSTVIIAGLLAASVAVGTVVIARSTIGDSLISTSTTATEISATPIATPTKIADRFAPVAALAAVPAPSITADTGEFLGAFATGAVDAGSSMAVFGTDNPTVVASSAAPNASEVVQQAINEALAERQAATAEQLSAYEVVQQSIDTALAERQAAVADRATTSTQGPGSNSLDATSVDRGSYMAAYGTDNPTVVVPSAAPLAADTGEFLGGQGLVDHSPTTRGLAGEPVQAAPVVTPASGPR